MILSIKQVASIREMHDNESHGEYESFNFMGDLMDSHESIRAVGLRTADSLKKCSEENVQLKAALLEVTGNYAVQGKKLELAIETLILSRQFCTWLCEDSVKYRGTDAAHAARSKQIEIGKCLEKLK